MAAKFAPARGEFLRHALCASPASMLPGFLVPAWQGCARRHDKQFSTTTGQRSKLGRTPILIPPGVELTVGPNRTLSSKTSYQVTVKKTVKVKGPLATLELDVPEFVNFSQDAGNRQVMVSVDDADVKEQREMWGTTWAYLKNHVTGVSEGHTAILRLVGVGYRATVEERASKEQFPRQRFLCLKLGFTHPIAEGIPKGVTVTAATPTRILIEGSDREAIMSFAGRVRLRRPPEPYKGKGIFINDETIKLKQKKIK